MTQHKNLSSGAIHIPYNWTYADETEREDETDVTAADIGKLARQLDDNTLWMLTDDSPVTWVQIGAGSTSYPKTWTMWHDQSKVINGNAIRLSNNTNQPYGRYADQNAPANGDITENGFLIAAGTYTLKFLAIRETDAGILDISIDGGSVVGSIDFYGSLAWGQIYSIASVVIASDGYHKMTMTINGKNGSSSGYHAYLTKMWLEPSAY